MKKNILAEFHFVKMILWFLLIFFMSFGAARAQSTLEYTILTGGVVAAEKDNKEKAKNQDQKESQASSGGISGLVEDMAKKPYGKISQVLSSSAGSLSAQGENVQSKKTEDQRSLKHQTYPLIKVYLKNGHNFQGRMLEQKENYIKIYLYGTLLTFFKDEIDHIEYF